MKKLPLSLRAYGFRANVYLAVWIECRLMLQKSLIDGSKLLDRHVAVVDEPRLSIVAVRCDSTHR